MKVLFLIDGLSKGGKERQLVELVKGLSVQKNMTLELILMNKAVDYEAIFDLGPKVTFLIRKTKRDPSVFFKLYRICSRFRPDIIHTWDSMTTFYVLPYKMLHAAKLINGSIRFAANDLSGSFRMYHLNKFLFRFSSVVVANSRAGLRTFGLTESAKNRCIYNGFDFSRVHNLSDPATLKNQLELGTKNVVAMVASFEEHKDNETYVLTALSLLKTRDDVVFLAIGEGKNLDRCKALASNHPSVRFLGKRNDVEALINVCDIGVLCSNTGKWGEGISNSVLEFYALNVPVVATDSGGTNEVVKDNVSGYLLKPNDQGHLFEKLNQLLDNPDLRSAMGKAGNEIVKQNFALSTMIENYGALYKQMLN